MISLNESNTAWFGKPVGLLTEPAWFAKSSVEKREELAKFEWIEFKCPLDATPSSILLQQEGFFWVDVTIGFRLSLEKVQPSESMKHFDCLSAVDRPFEIGPDDVKDFGYERFAKLPGMTIDVLNQRYVNWSNQMIAAQPEYCFVIERSGKVQGWFLGQRKGAAIGLTLAMLAKGASSSGSSLYQKALLAYAGQGFTLGEAAFSVRNMPVMNIYAALGARFLKPLGVWMWHRSTLPA